MKNYQGMEFRQIAYFVAVAEDLHFRHAAERLHIVQPALSQQIARLEAELGVTLLSRTKRTVALTAAGQAFLKDARVLLELREQAVETARRVGHGQAGSLHAGFVGPAAYSVLRWVIRVYRTSFPDVGLTLDELPTGEQLDRLAAGTLDLGIVRLPVNDERVTVVPLVSEAIIAVLPEGHRLSAESVVDVADLAGEPFIIVSRAQEPTSFDRCVSLCTRAGFSPRVVQEGMQIRTIVELVAAGFGVSLAPESLAQLRRPGVVYRPVANPYGIRLETGLAWRSEDVSPTVEGFVQTAVDTVRAGNS
jgi:DNA-binding transcriptional LysR family regulator